MNDITGNSAGAWWAGLAAIVAGIIGCVAIQREWVLTSAVLSGAAAAVCLAGAVVDGLMADTFWKNMGYCRNRSGSEFGDSKDQNKAALYFCGQYKANYYEVKTTPNTFTVTTLGSSAGKSSWQEDGNQDDRNLFCVRSGSENMVSSTAATSVGSSLKYPIGSTTWVITNEFYNNLGSNCYQIPLNSGYNPSDASRLRDVFSASCAFSVLCCALSVALMVICSMAYSWHPVREIREEEQVDIEVPRVVPAPPPAILPPTLPPSPQMRQLPPAPVGLGTTSIDLKPLGQIK